MRELRRSVEELGAKLTTLEYHLRSMLLRGMDSIEKLPANEARSLYLILSFAVNTLYDTYLRINGHNLVNHPVHHELKRIRSYMFPSAEIGN